MSCPSCSLEASRKWIGRDHAIEFPDAYPAADGHMLIGRASTSLVGLNVGVASGCFFSR